MIARQPADRVWPKVSLHLAIYNEPPAMVIQTLDALAALDYPNFEVLVIDNNTKDPAVWRPVEDYCASAGRALPLLPLRLMKGFKAGALNYVLTTPRPTPRSSRSSTATTWCRRTGCPRRCRTSTTRKISFVQAPQDYRDWQRRQLQGDVNWEYPGFFDIGMCRATSTTPSSSTAP